ncbi:MULTISPECIES: IclR family transcriptional regulator [Neobacillus]|uniref:IclR family transcriptional regulator n=1 Tax=Neobacillus citreus TaxID=2833578 RepID=A0A942T3M9_9BACI|nr:IclR family transcriptional regulator [Neobacillus citreus]MCH6264243.1 IclR family transcriptional regulator [Neobacillus citreus]
MDIHLGKVEGLTGMGQKQSLVPALDSSIKILELLAKQEFHSATLTEIANALSINFSTCLRILRTLEEKNYVVLESSSKTYSLGPPLIALGNRAKEINNYIEVASMYLKDLVKTGLTFVLVKRLRETHLMYVAKEEPPLKVRLTVSTGDSFPITAGALGKCFFAFLPEKDSNDVVTKLLIDHQLPQYTSNSITAIEDLKKQVPKIREEGIAESHEEYSLGISAYACPIFDSQGNIILGLGSYMPKSLIEHIHEEELKAIMKSKAQEITQAISSLV